MPIAASESLAPKQTGHASATRGTARTATSCQGEPADPAHAPILLNFLKIAVP